MQKVPKSIFKYFPPKDEILESISQNKIFFGSPESFNDPYDCNVGYTPKVDLSKAKIYENYEEIAEFDLLKQRDFFTNSFDLASKFLLESIRCMGISCFSETNKNLLMWSHYAQNAEGFCLEYNTDFKPFDTLLKINYSENFPEIDIIEILGKTENGLVSRNETLKLILTKSIDWKYEKEWRIIHEKKNIKYQINSNCVKSFFLGPKINPITKEKLISIAKSMNTGIKVFQGKVSKTKFEILFNEIDYH